MSATDQIMKASADFYAALNRMAAGDAQPMSAVWAQGDDVSAQHPIGGRDQGYDAVIGSFGMVAQVAGGGEIRLENQQIVAGSDMAVETGVEVGSITIAGHKADINQRVTNVYRAEGAVWKMVHHHTDQSEAMLEILKKLQGSA